MKENKVKWDAVYSFEVVLVIDKHGVLKPMEIVVKVKQEINGGDVSEKLGEVRLCLSSFATKISHNHEK